MLVENLIIRFILGLLLKKMIFFKRVLITLDPKVPQSLFTKFNK